MAQVLRFFVDASGNYFEASFNTQAQADAYGVSGLTETPRRPSSDHAWQGGAWVYVAPTPPVITIEQVKAEAERRIVAILPAYAQRNSLALFAETAQTHGVDPSQWPAQLQAINNAAMGKWAAIKAIRAKSDALEAMNPIPVNYDDDSWW